MMKDAEILDPSYSAEGVKWYSHYGKQHQFLKNLKMPLSYNSLVALMAIYAREMNIYVHTKACA